MVLGMEEAPQDMDDVKDWILLSTWLGWLSEMELEPVETGVRDALRGWETTAEEEYVGGSGGLSERQN